MTPLLSTTNRECDALLSLPPTTRKEEEAAAKAAEAVKQILHSIKLDN